MKNSILTCIKFIFVALVFYWLSQQGWLSVQETQQAFQRYELLVIALIFFFLGDFLAIFRWYLLLRAQEIDLPWSRVLQLGVVGIFFNMALPGVVSGDVVKAIYVGRESSGKRAHALSSILFDRVLGLSGLIYISTLMTLLQDEALFADSTMVIIRKTLVSASLVLTLFFLYLFLIRAKNDPIYRLMQKIKKDKSPLASLKRIYEGLLAYRAHPPAVMQSLFLSVIVHISVAYGIFCLYRSYNETLLTWQLILVVVPLGLVASAIPILPMGIGTGHAAFIALFLIFKSSRGADVFNLYLLTRLISGGLAGLYYLKFKSRKSLLSPPSLAQS